MMMHESLSLKIVILILTVLWLFSTIGCFMFDEIERNDHSSFSDLFIDLKELQYNTLFTFFSVNRLFIDKYNIQLSCHLLYKEASMLLFKELLNKLHIYTVLTLNVAMR